MNISVLVYLASLLSFKLAPTAGLLHTIVLFGAFVALPIAAAFVMRLAARLHSFLIAIAMGLFTLFPLVGLLVPYVLNGQAVDLLKRQGYGSGGMLGMDLSQFGRQ